MLPSLAVSMTEYMAAARSPPAFDRANNQFLRRWRWSTWRARRRRCRSRPRPRRLRSCCRLRRTSGGALVYLFLDWGEAGDPVKQVASQRRRAGGMVLAYLAAEMRPAGNLPDPASGIELVVAGVDIGLEETGEVLENGLRMDTATTFDLDEWRHLPTD